MASFETRTSNVYAQLKKAHCVAPGIRPLYRLEDFREWFKRVHPALAQDEVARCCYCDAYITLKTFQCDHRKPINRGGSMDLENLAICCARCNQAKGQLLDWEFHALLKGLEKFTPEGAANILHRLRTAEAGKQVRFYGKEQHGQRQSVRRSTVTPHRRPNT